MNVLRELEKGALKTTQGEIVRVSCTENWTAGQNPDLQLFTSGQGNPEDMDMGPFLRFVKDAARVDSMVTTLQTLLDTAQNLQNSYNTFLPLVVAKTSLGIACLPDELLLLIFHFANLLDHAGVNGDSICHSKTPMYISHVSRRFRGIALDGQILWTTLHSDAKEDELTTFIDRSCQRNDLRVVIHVKNSNWDGTDFMDICWPTAPRWNSLAIIENGDLTGDERMLDSVLGKMDQYGLQLPQLHELYLAHNYGCCSEEGFDFATPRFLLRWASPNLRSLRSSHYVPQPSLSLSFLSSFSISISVTIWFYLQVRETFDFVAATPTIAHFALHLEDTSDPAGFGELFCPHVASFELRVSGFRVSEDENIFIGEIIKALKLPSLTHFSISVYCCSTDYMGSALNEDSSMIILSELARRLLPNHIIHNQLVSLDIKLFYDVPNSRIDTSPIVTDYFRDAEVQLRMFTVPLDRIPNVSSLTLTTFPRLKIRFSPPTLVICNLRELKLRECKNIDSEELRNIVLSLEEVGAWQGLERVRLEGCKALQYEEALDAVGSDRLHYSNR